MHEAPQGGRWACLSACVTPFQHKGSPPPPNTTISCVTFFQCKEEAGRMSAIRPSAQSQAALFQTQALDNAKIEWKEKEASKLDLARCGILIGTAMGGMQTFATACEDLAFRVTPPPSSTSIPFSLAA